MTDNNWSSVAILSHYYRSDVYIFSAATIGTVRYYVWIKNTHTDELHKYKNDYTGK